MNMIINALVRNCQGKGASRRLRNKYMLPAVVYGAGKKTTSIILNAYEINKLLDNEDAYTSVIDLMFNKIKEPVIIKALQRHPAKNNIIHVDLQRVSSEQVIVVSTPIHIVGTENNNALRIGSVINIFVSMVKISCLPKDLLHSIDIDVSSLKTGEHLSLTDIKLPDGVNIIDLQHDNIEAYNKTIVSITVAKKQEEITDDAASEQDVKDIKDSAND